MIAASSLSLFACAGGAFSEPFPGGGTSTAIQAPADAVGRVVAPLSTGWRFRFGGDEAGITAANYDDSAWQTVDLPHTWNRLGEYRLTRSEATDVQRGVGWYRLSLAAQPQAGRRQILQFDGVGAIAEVWVNGVRVGEHRGAFSGFRFDITDQLKPGPGNVIVVKADNSEPAVGSSTQDVLPLGGDFFIHGGLYRGVSLIAVDEAQIDLFDHGGPGVYVSTPYVGAERAEVQVLTRLRNIGARARPVSVVTRIVDADGAIVATDTTATRLAGGATEEVRRTIDLADPRLWQGREDPCLYRVTVELRDGAHVIDRVEQPFGVRTFAFDPDTGFSLNGRSISLHGASRHQEVGGKGWALTDEDHARDMALMAEMGINTVRQAHYQHAQAWTDEADRTGMVVWAELPFVHETSLTHGAPTEAFQQNARDQLLELIRQNYNHPSVMIWSVGNEIDIGAAIANMTGQSSVRSQSRAMLTMLDALARQEDPTRVTAYADCCEGTALEQPGSEVLTNVTGIVALNRYFGWYYGKPSDLGRALDDYHARYPATPLVLSEYGAGGALTQHTDDPLGGAVSSRGRPHPEEYQSYVHEQSWKVLKDRPYLAASWLWNMFDFGSTTREEGDAIDLNNKGLISSDRTIRKDAFYFYKANWSTEPVLHLNGRRYLDRAYPVTDVRAYSNAENVSLSVNGVSVGEAACPDRICVWPSVPLAAGLNTLIATGTVNGQPVTDTIAWTAPDPSLGLNIDTGTLTGGTGEDGVRFGSDAFFEGGQAKELNGQGLGRRRGPALRIEGAGAQAPLYDAWREGSFRYNLPLPDGNWTVTLHFAEADAALASSRTFSVITGARVLLSDFNTVSEAGGVLKAVRKTFDVTVVDGRLVLDFISDGGPAIVSAITVTPSR